jgi:hypothetical protein
LELIERLAAEITGMIDDCELEMTDEAPRFQIKMLEV